MTPFQLSDEEIAHYSEIILNSSKYRTLDIPRDLVDSLYQQEAPHHKKIQDLHKSVRKKLHHIVANYLGDVDYEQASQNLRSAFAQGPDAIRTACLNILKQHISTRERTPFLERFYQEISSRIGKPKSILDLACGYHPFGLPWMNLDPECQYYAYDIIQPRVDFLNLFFDLVKHPARAIQQDILQTPPTLEADVAFFFKEAHRFEQRQHGCNYNFWQALKVRHLLVSLPASSMTGRHDKTNQHRRLVYETIKDVDWAVQEFQIENELFFWIRK